MPPFWVWFGAVGVSIAVVLFPVILLLGLADLEDKGAQA